MDVGAYIALVGIGVACGLANRGKPKPALTAGRKTIALTCLGIAIGCFALLAAVIAVSSHSPAVR